jgi:hypothetical protein
MRTLSINFVPYIYTVNFDIKGSYESKKWLGKSNIITESIRYAKKLLSLALGVT